MSRHHLDTIRDQFTRQADDFADAPAIRDEGALALVLDAAGAQADDRALDVACGPGLLACALARVVRHATGIDLVPAMLARARTLQREIALTNVAWTLGDVTALPYADETFSLVTTRYALHHMPDPAGVVAEMARVCRRGGRVTVVDVTASPDPAKAALFNEMERARDPSHTRALSLAEVNDILAGIGVVPTPPVRYRLDVDVEDLLARSRPDPGGADRVRAIVADSIDGDRMGVDARREGAALAFSFPIAVITATRR